MRNIFGAKLHPDILASDSAVINPNTHISYVFMTPRGSGSILTPLPNVAPPLANPPPLGSAYQGVSYVFTSSSSPVEIRSTDIEIPERHIEIPPSDPNSGSRVITDDMDVTEDDTRIAVGHPGSRSAPISISSSPTISHISISSSPSYEWPVERPASPPSFFVLA